MVLETKLRHFLVFRPRTSVVCVRIDGDSTARGENSGHFYILRIHQLNQILHDFVHAVLMKIAMVTETEQVEFQAFGLNHTFVGHIGNLDFRKVRLPGNRTKAREFRTVELYPIIIVRMLIDE